MVDYPDFTVIARLKGEYAGAEKAVAVDTDGQLKALLYGTYSGANKAILVDVNGNVRMNLYAQDLDQMVNRFKYGAPDFALYSGIPGVGAWTAMIDVDGTGFIYQAHVRSDGTALGNRNDNYKCQLDGVFGAEHAFVNLNTWGATADWDFFFVLNLYDAVNFNFSATCGNQYTFESNCTLSYWPTVAVNNVACHFFHALI